MQAIIYYISLPFIYFISVLPFWCIYRVSDCFYFFIYHVFGYRKNVVLENLKNSFPEKSDPEVKLIAKKFYVFFCDWIVEMIKSITISEKQALKRCHFSDYSLLESYAKQNQKLIFVMGHMGNFELGGAEVAINTDYQLYVIYKPQSNKDIDRLIKNKRMRFGSKVIPMKGAFKQMISSRNDGELSATTFIGDQTPSPKNAYWTTFLNQDTPIFWGTEVIARKLNHPVIYVAVTQTKRGYYVMTPTLLCEKPSDTKEGEISEWHTNKLEEEIKKQPELWLWSHRRWKHQRPQN